MQVLRPEVIGDQLAHFVQVPAPSKRSHEGPTWTNFIVKKKVLKPCLKLNSSAHIVTRSIPQMNEYGEAVFSAKNVNATSIWRVPNQPPSGKKQVEYGMRTSPVLHIWSVRRYVLSWVVELSASCYWVVDWQLSPHNMLWWIVMSATQGGVIREVNQPPV